MGKKDKSSATSYEVARNLLQQGDLEQAEKMFTDLLQKEEEPRIRNNLATAKYEQQDFSGTLAVLGPNLRLEQFNPYARALAAMAYIEIDKLNEAEKVLNQAVTQFNWGATQYGDSWFEYLVIIAKAAGMLGKHQLITELHQKWNSRYTHPDSFLLAGIAFFNLGSYRQAISNWKKVVEQIENLKHFMVIAGMIDSGVIPPFLLEYQRIDFPEDIDEQWFADHMMYGRVKMMLLDMAFDNPEEKTALDVSLGMLIKYSADWGMDLAEAILKADSLDMAYKTATAKVLVELGIYQADQAIPMRVDGKDTLVKLEMMNIALQNDALDQIVARAIKLAQKGKYDEAETILRPLLAEQVMYPSAQEVLARVCYSKGNFSEAATLLEPLIQINQGNPYAVLLMAETQYQLGEMEKATDYLIQVEPENIPDDLVDEFYEFSRLILNEKQFSGLMAAQREQYQWQQVWNKPLPQKLTLASCLKQIPVEWLNVICNHYHLKPARLRKDRECQIAEFLQKESVVADTVLELDDQAKALLSWLVLSGGRTKLGTVTKNFGSMEDEHYYWADHPPQTAVGQLIARGLAFIGTLPDEKGRLYKRVIIPDDLVEAVQKCLNKLKV